MKQAVFAIALTSFVLPAVRAAEIDYARDIKPILAEHCYKCHGPDKQTHELRLDQRAFALHGGASGKPALEPGKPDESHLIQLITKSDPDERMPRKSDPLSADQIDKLRAWIAAGAPMPGDDTMAYKRMTSHWSFQPITDPTPPNVDAPTNNPIDAFILDRLAKDGLTLSPEADRRTLIRRVYLVMLGLPPTEDEVQAFIQDPSPDAYAQLVERVLASPRYGERWAQHWLDVIRYADTHGFEMNQPRKDAYHFRDWVISALNSDLPYDQFVFDQLAGDTVNIDEATGFLVAGAWDQVKGQDPQLGVQQRANELHDIVSVVSQSLLGLTVGCARCHDHKFDPVLQKDYYALTAVFAGVQHGSRPMRLPLELAQERAKQVAVIDGRLGEIDSRLSDLGDVRGDAPDAQRNIERFEPVVATRVRFSIFATNNGSQPCIDEIELISAPLDGSKPTNVALATAGAKASASSLLPGYDIHQIPHLNDGQYGNAHSWISNESGSGWAMIELPAASRIDRLVWGRDRDGKYVDRIPTSYVIEIANGGGPWVAVASSPDRAPGIYKPDRSQADRAQIAQLKKEKAELEAERKKLDQRDTVYAGRFVQPAPTHRLFRGDPFSPREEVAPDVISILGSVPMAMNEPEANRRVAFAKWVVDPSNPLTARVLVNRLWQEHFGTGIVDTPSDFGGNGTAPSHPKLLDWLAREFIRGGWSIKHMHRLILTSRTFRQSTDANDKAMAIDRGARLLWRYPTRRLQAEPMRDSMLAAAGVLDLSMGGPGFGLFEPNANYVRNYEPKTEWGPAEFRRMIYAEKVRMEGAPVFGAFDCPDAGQSQPKRPRSTTAIQSLNLFNSSFTMTVAADLAQRVEKEAGPDTQRQIDRAFMLVLERKPTDAERAAVDPLVSEHGLTELARVLFNTNEFLFIP
ncbi:MAG: DUF1553 domain-containing protein [Planctomycetes bacterium]|nr:DUF1553 domain-containing protein [Planctomycetota bacterium]